MYFWDHVSTYNDQLRRANLDGSNIETLLELPEFGDFAAAIAVDTIHDKIYWTQETNDPGPSAFVVRRANLDGSNVETLPMPLGIFETRGASQIALDVSLPDTFPP